MEDPELSFLQTITIQAVSECFDTDLLDLVYKLLVSNDDKTR